MRHLLSSLLKQRSAISSLEFALIAPLLVALIFAAMQMALVVFAQAVLESATRAAGRYIETGQAAAAGEQGFQTALCSALHVGPMTNCNADPAAVNDSVYYYVALPPVFNYTIPYLKYPPSPSVYQCAAPVSAVILQVFYHVPQLVPLIGRIFSLSGSFTLGSTVAFYTQNFSVPCS